MVRWARWLVLLLLIGLGTAFFWIRAVNQREQAAADARVAAEVNKLVTVALRELPADNHFIKHCGAFQSWQPERWSRMGRMDWRPPRLHVRGMARFEKADVPVSIDVARGPSSVKISGMQADWLKEHPEQRVRIIDRRLVTSEWFFDEPAPPGQAAAGADVEPIRSEGYGYIEIAASHPDMMED